MPAAKPTSATTRDANTTKVRPGDKRRWVPAGEGIVFDGVTVPGGLLYVGRPPKSDDDWSSAADPSLMDPKLPINRSRPDTSGETMEYWPEYREMTPRARGAYVEWLAGGRVERATYIGYVFLFYYGLEHRALVDLISVPATDQARQRELAQIRKELVRLRSLYAVNHSFDAYSNELLEALDLMLAVSEDVGDPPTLATEQRWRVPARLRVGLGKYAAAGELLPAEWALAWVWYHPDARLGMVASRCAEEFAQLFTATYQQARTKELVLKPGRKKLQHHMYGTSRLVNEVRIRTDIPDVFDQAPPLPKLLQIAEAARLQLDPLARFLGRNPDGRHSLGAAALLPAEIRGEPAGELKVLADWAAGLAESGEVSTGEQLFAHWPIKAPHRMAKAEAVALAQLLGSFGLAVEPDVRLGGPAITPTSPVVIFRAGPQPPQTADPVYTAATTLLHLAVAVAVADGDINAPEQEELVAHMESALHLSDGERARLEAHLRWLLATDIKLTGLKRRLERLTTAQREQIADLLVAVSAADGVTSSSEISTLQKIFGLLQLDHTTVHSRIHHHLTGGSGHRASAGPVTVRPAGEPDTGFPLGPRPPDAPPEAGRGGGRGVPVGGAAGAATRRSEEESRATLSLDAAVIAAKEAESANVSELLAGIFGEEDEPSPAPKPPAPGPGPGSEGGPDGGGASGSQEAATGGDGSAGPGASLGSIAGLDLAHSELMRQLAEALQWSRSDYEALVKKLGLMPDGAAEIINEASQDAVDEIFLETQDDPDLYTVNDYARQELFS